MDLAAYCKIIDELATLRPRRISPYLMNEPLLDRRLPEFVHYASERVPEATTLVTTNGTGLTEELGAALLDAGLKRLKVSLQSLDPKVNRDLMGPGCDSGKVVENVLAFKRLIKAKRARGFDLRVSMIVTRKNQDGIVATHRFWRRHGVRLVTSALENRGGNIGDAASLNPHAMATFRRGCVRPMREMCILWNGDAVLCCVDWWRTEILGNVLRQSVREVWNSPRLNEIRQGLHEGGEGVLPEICVNCAESAAPGYHRGLWQLLRRWRGRAGQSAR